MGEITVNGEPVHGYLDKKKGEEANRDFMFDVVSKTDQAMIRKSAYLASKRMTSRSLYDKKAKHGGVKHYTRGEVMIENIRRTLSDRDKKVYDIIFDEKNPISFKKMMEHFHIYYPDLLSKKSRMSFENAVDKLASLGLVEKLSKTDNTYTPHRYNTELYIKAKNPSAVNREAEQEFSNQAESPEQAAVGEQRPEPPAAERQAAGPEQDMYDYLNLWMDKNGIAELSISIKKRK